ncbi:MAG: hypothetical protein IT198_04795 [Acidimicrobiia bacterium]|nr:hypothetical protein [Acidimicrobiia bacterium]
MRGKLTRWGVGGIGIVVLLVLVIGGAQPPAEAAGLAFACETSDDPVTEVEVNDDPGVAGTHLLVKATTQGGTVTDEVIDTADPDFALEMLTLLVQATWPQGYVRSMDVDGDGANDYAYSIKTGRDIAPLNADAVWDDQFGLPHTIPNTPLRTYGSLTLRAFRIVGNAGGFADPDVPPVTFEFAVVLDLIDDNGANVGTKNVTVTFDQKDSAVPLGESGVDLFLGGDPATNRLAVVVREEHTYYSGTTEVTSDEIGDPPAALQVAVRDMTPQGPGDALFDGTLGWSAAPAQFAFGILTDCTAAIPSNEMAWDWTSNRAGAPPKTAPAPNLDLDLTVGEGEGVSYETAGNETKVLPTVGIAGTVATIPEWLAIELGKERLRVTHTKRPIGQDPPQPSDPKPDLTIDAFVLGGKDEDPATDDEPIVVAGELTQLPPFTVADLVLVDEGGIEGADVRFCDGTWGSPECTATLGAPTNVRLDVGNVPDGLAHTLPALPAQAPYVYYASRDTGSWGMSDGSNAPPTLAREDTWRFAASAPGVTHVDVDVPANAGVTADAETAGAPDVRVLFDIDSRVTTVQPGIPKPVSVTKGQAMAVSATAVPLPSHMRVEYLPTKWVPLDLALDFFGTATRVENARFRYAGDTESDELEIEGAGSMGEAAGSTPSKLRIRYQKPGRPYSCPNQTPPLCRDPYTHIDWTSNKETKVHVGIVASTQEDRAADRRMRVFGEATFAPLVRVDILAPPSGLARLRVQRPGCPLDAPTCIIPYPPSVAPVVRDLRAKVIREVEPDLPAPGEPCDAACQILKLLADPATEPSLPALQYGQPYPSFNDSSRNVRFVMRDDDLWGGEVALGQIRKVDVERSLDQGSTRGCITGIAEPVSLGVGLFLNMHEEDEPVAPVYVDGEIGQIPQTVAFRLNPNAPAGTPLVVFSSVTCDTTTVPTTATQTTGLALRAVVRLGPPDVQLEMGQGGTDSLRLTRPEPGWPRGGRVNVLVAPTGTAVDANIETLLPDRFVMLAPDIKTCGATLEDPRCKTSLLPVTGVDDLVEVKAGYRTTLRHIGSLDAQVRFRTRLADTRVDGDNTCHDGVCDMDVFAHADRVVGLLDARFKLQQNRRVPMIHMDAKLDGLLSDTGNEMGTVSVNVIDDAAPACYGNRGADGCDTTSGVPVTPVHTWNQSIILRDVGVDLAVAFDFQGVEGEGVDANIEGCTVVDHEFRGDLGLGYAHAEIDMLPGKNPRERAKSLKLVARLDPLTRVRAELSSDKPVDGQVWAKLKNLGLSIDPPPLVDWGAENVELDACMDADVPLKIQFWRTTRLTMSLDKLYGKLAVNPVDVAQRGASASLRVGERIGSAFVDGVYWARNYLDLKIDGVLSLFEGMIEPFERNRTNEIMSVDFLGIPYWNVSPWLTRTTPDYWRYYSTNWISTSTTPLYSWPNSDPPCCSRAGTVSFQIDPIFNADQRQELLDYWINVIGDILGTHPGFFLYHALWDLGSQATVDSPVVGTFTSTAPSAVGSITWNLSTPARTPAELDAFGKTSPVIATGPDGTTYRLLFGMHWPRRIVDEDQLNSPWPNAVYDFDDDLVDQCKDVLELWDGSTADDPFYGGPHAEVCKSLRPILSLEARYANGERRWVKTLVDTADPGANLRPTNSGELAGCGIAWTCKLKGTVEFLPGGHLDLRFRVQRPQTDAEGNGNEWIPYLQPFCPTDPDLTYYTFYRFTFEPSGRGGQTRFDVDSLDPTHTAHSIGGVAGQPIALTQGTYGTEWWNVGFGGLDFTNGCDSVTANPTRKVWYFGDGSYQDVTGDVADPNDGTVGIAPPTDHVYDAPGTYPAMLVYYRRDTSQLTRGLTSDWIPFRWIPVDVNVTAPP